MKQLIILLLLSNFCLAQNPQIYSIVPEKDPTEALPAKDTIKCLFLMAIPQSKLPYIIWGSKERVKALYERPSSRGWSSSDNWPWYYMQDVRNLTDEYKPLPENWILLFQKELEDKKYPKHFEIIGL